MNDDGSATLGVDDETLITGFFNTDGSLAVFRRFWSEGDEMELDLFILAELEYMANEQ